MGKGGLSSVDQVKQIRDRVSSWASKISGGRSQRGFKNTPTGKNVFGESITGDFGARIRKDPSQAARIRESVANIRNMARQDVAEIRKQVRDLRDQGRRRDADDLIESHWRQAESEIMRYRDQYDLYRGSAQERSLDQAIRSNIYKLKTMEELAGIRPPAPKRDFDKISTRKPGETRGRKSKPLPPGEGWFQ